MDFLVKYKDIPPKKSKVKRNNSPSVTVKFKNILSKFTADYGFPFQVL